MLVRNVLKEGLLAILVQTAVCLNLSKILGNESSECNVNFDKKEKESVDLSYMYEENELHVLVEGPDSEYFVPGLEAMLGPFISLEIGRLMENIEVDNSSLKTFKLEGPEKSYLRALYGSMKSSRTYHTYFKVVSDPTIRISGSFVMTGVNIGFLEYNASVSSGNYIGYNLAVHTDLELIYMVSLEQSGTNVDATFHLEISGVGPMVFSDNTNCEIVEKQSSLNLGRTCDPQVLEKVTKWKGVSKNVVAFVRPAVFQTVWCSFKNVIPGVAEIAAAYAVLLTK